MSLTKSLCSMGLLDQNRFIPESLDIHCSPSSFRG